MVLALRRLWQEYQQFKAGRPQINETLSEIKEEKTLSLCPLGKAILPLLTPFAQSRRGID